MENQRTLSIHALLCFVFIYCVNLNKLCGFDFGLYSELESDKINVCVPNVHSNFNQFLLKIELKIAKFQFLISFSIFNFQFLTDIA